MEKTTARDRIVAAASDLFYERGIGTVGMDAVRDEAQVSLRALYKEFASKEDLVLAVLQLLHTQWEEGLAAQAAGITDPEQRLLAIFDYLSSWFNEPGFRGCGFINAFGELGASSTRVADAVRAHKHSFQIYVRDLVAQMGGPATLAAQLAILAEGAQVSAAIQGTDRPAQVARQAAKTLITTTAHQGAGAAEPTTV